MVRSLVLFLVACALCSCARTESTSAAPAGVTAHALSGPSHLLLVLELSPSGLKLVNARVVDQPLPHLRVPEKNAWHVSVRDPEGRSVHEEDIPPGNQLRGEFAGEDGRIDAHHLLKPTSVFSVRVPNVRGTLTLTAERRSLSSEDPRSIGAGETVEVGSVVLPENAK